MKDTRINLRISTENLAKIKHKANQANLTLTDYVTKVALGKQIVIIPDLAAVLKQQKALGRNLNQLTMLAHTGKVQTVYLAEFVDGFGDINRSLQEVLERKRWNDGNS